MIELSGDIEAPARKIARARGVSVEDAVAWAIEEGTHRPAKAPDDQRADAGGRGRDDRASVARSARSAEDHAGNKRLMIVVDNSARIAILEKEGDALRYAAEIEKADRLLISAVNVHETGIVLRIRRGATAVARMWRLLQEDNDFEIVPFDEAQARDALEAFNRFGKGLHAKARLNLSNCAAYALARSMKVPLLFKGADFS